MIRELKDVDIVKLEEDESPELPRAWMISDPPAIDATFPRMHLASQPQLTALQATI